MAHEAAIGGSTNVVTLRVGGVTFETSTLTLHDGFLARLVACGHVGGTFTVDRDPTHFRHILNFLRGAPSYPRDEQGLDELVAEADFYGLPNLVRHLELQRNDLRQRSIAHALSVLGTKLQH